MMLTILLIAVLLIAALYVALLSLISNAAKQRGRDPFSWILLSLVISPLVVLVLLYALPPADGPGPPSGYA
ncbi:MAG: hypothetical protein ABI559_08960 [Chloroflexota bacterium]